MSREILDDIEFEKACTSRTCPACKFHYPLFTFFKVIFFSGIKKWQCTSCKVYLKLSLDIWDNFGLGLFHISIIGFFMLVGYKYGRIAYVILILYFILWFMFLSFKKFERKK